MTKSWLEALYRSEEFLESKLVFSGGTGRLVLMPKKARPLVIPSLNGGPPTIIPMTGKVLRAWKS